MVLEELEAVPGSALPVTALADHLRLGTAFAGDLPLAGLLESHLRAAIAAIEARTGKALLRRAFRLRLGRWRGAGLHPLPVAPVVALGEVALLSEAGARIVLGPNLFALVPDMHRPKLVAVSGTLPPIAERGLAEIGFQAGFAESWDGVPPDLAQAVLLLAAEFHENRHDPGDGRAGMPASVLALIGRWRTVRVLGGGGA